MKQYQNKKLNFIAAIVLGFVISATTTNIFADTCPSPLPPSSSLPLPISPPFQPPSSSANAWYSGQIQDYLGGLNSNGIVPPACTLYTWISNINSASNNFQTYFNILFGTGVAPTQTLTTYIDNEISTALTTPPTGPSATPSAAYAAVQGTINYFINQAFNSSSTEYPTFQSAVNSLIATALAPATSTASAGSIMAAINSATNNFASVSSVANALSSGSTTMPSAVDSYIQTELSSNPSNQTIQSAVNSFVNSVIKNNALAPASKSLPNGGSITQAVNTAVSSAVSPLQKNINTINKTTIPALQKKQDTHTKNITALQLQQAKNTNDIKKMKPITIKAFSDLQTNLTNQITGLTGTTGAVTNAISAAVNPLQTNFSTLFGGSSGPTKSLTAYIDSEITNQYQNIASSAQIQKAMEQIVHTLLTGKDGLITDLQTSVTDQIAGLTGKDGAVTQAINTAISSSNTTFQSAVDSRITSQLNVANNPINTAMNTYMNFVLTKGVTFAPAVNSVINNDALAPVSKSLPNGGSITQAISNAINPLQSDINTINNTTIPALQKNLTNQITGLTGKDGVVTQAISTAISPLQSDINTINNTTIPALTGKDGTVTQAINTAVSNTVSSSNATFQSAVDSRITSQLNAANNPINTAMNQYINYILTQGSTFAPAVNKVIANQYSGIAQSPSVQSAITDQITNGLASGGAIQTAISTATAPGQNGVWYVNNLNNLQTTLNNAGAVASATNPQTVRLAAGNGSVKTNGGVLVIPSNVTLEGAGKLATQLHAINNATSKTATSGASQLNAYAIVMETGSTLANLSVWNDATPTPPSSISNPLLAIALDCKMNPTCTFTLDRVMVVFRNNSGSGTAMTFINSVSNQTSTPVATLNLDSSTFYASNIFANSSTATIQTSSAIYMTNNTISMVGAESSTGCTIFDSSFSNTGINDNPNGFSLGNLGNEGTTWKSC